MGCDEGLGDVEAVGVCGFGEAEGNGYGVGLCGGLDGFHIWGFDGKGVLHVASGHDGVYWSLPVGGNFVSG